MRHLAVVWLAAVVLAQSPAQAAVCDERPPPAPPTKADRFAAKVRDEQRARSSFGMPDSRAAALRGLRQGRHLPAWGLHLLPRELRFFHAVLRMQRTFSEFSDPVHAYTRRYPAEFAGLRLGTDFPRGGVLVVHWTRRAAQHTADLRAIVPFPVRGPAERYSWRALRRAQQRIPLARLARRGIKVVGSGTDVQRNRVEVDVISRRPDAVSAAQRVLGPKYAVRLVARRAFRTVCGAPDLVTVSRDGRTLHMDLGTSGSIITVRPFLAEEAGRVRVAIVLREPTTFLTSDLVPHQAEVRLTEPLGDREVVFAGTGEPLKVRRR